MNEKQLEDALHTWPLAEVPTGFSEQVMKKVKPREISAQIPQEIKLKFRLTWMDFALGGFLSMLPALVFISFLTLPRKFILYLQYQRLVFQFPAYETAALVIFGCVALLSLLVGIFTLRAIFPRLVV
jgi:hypothetical protein